MSHMTTLTTLPRDILRLIVATIEERDFLALRHASAVFYRWSLASDAPWMKVTEVWEDRWKVSRSGSVLQSHDSSSVPRWPPHWRMRAMVEAFCVSDVWKDEERVKRIVAQVKAILESERTLAYISAPVTIITAPYGRWEALTRLLLIAGGPLECPLLFMGPYVASTAVEQASTKSLILIWLLKITYPDRVTLLPLAKSRCRSVLHVPNNMHLQEPIDYMPKAALIASKIICSPGGIWQRHMTLGLMDAPNNNPEINRAYAVLRARPVMRNDAANKIAWQRVGRLGRREFGALVTSQFLRDNDLNCLVMNVPSGSVPFHSWLHNNTLLGFFSTSSADLRVTFVRVLSSEDLSVVTLIK